MASYSSYDLPSLSVPDVNTIRQAECGTLAADRGCQPGVGEATFYTWKKKHAHLGVRSRRSSLTVEEENSRLKRLAQWFHGTFQVSCAPACRLAQFGWASWYRQSRAKDQSALRLRIRDLAHARPRYGYLRIWVLLRRESWLINRKRVRRLYRLDE